MKLISKQIAVPNCLLFIRDAQNRDYPEIDGDEFFWRTPSCVAVGCLPDSEGDTAISLGGMGDIPAGLVQIFDGEIETPGRKVVVDIVPGTTILESEVAGRRTHIQVWTNGDSCSDVVFVCLRIARRSGRNLRDNLDGTFVSRTMPI